MPDFAAVAEQFRKLHCSHCRRAFTPDAVTPLRRETDYWVVRVVCTACNHPSGVAVVGAETESSPTPRRAKPERPSAFSSRKEERRFATLAPIGIDDVLDASKRIRELGADWARQLRDSR